MPAWVAIPEEGVFDGLIPPKGCQGDSQIVVDEPGGSLIPLGQTQQEEHFAVDAEFEGFVTEVG